MKKYISDIITKHEICQWSEGDKILISAITGSGKSNWVKNTLYEVAKKNKKKILLLSNRNALKRQNQSEIGDDKSDVIILRNYQSIEKEILETKESVVAFLDSFDYVCFDECHYWFSDSEFNRNTNILIETLRRKQHSAIYIYITATPQVVLLYKKEFDYTYPKKSERSILGDYSFIDEVCFYNKDETVESILSNIPHGEKAIYFSKALQSFEMSLLIPNSAFICSEQNDEFAKKASKTTLKEIEETEDFTARVLCTTTVLDNGISIKNDKLKHIIVDIPDPILLLQSIGRKRISDGEKIKVYIKNYHNGDIHFRIGLLSGRMKYVAQRLDLGKDGFQELYARNNFDPIIQNDMEINQAKLYQTKYLKETMETMIRDGDKMGYAKYICNLLGFPFSDIKWAETVYEKIDMKFVLESFLGKRMYKGDQQDNFKTMFFEKVFSPKRIINYRHRGLNSINSILEEDGLPYMLVSRIGYEHGKRGRRYWQVVKIGDDIIEQCEPEDE